MQQIIEKLIISKASLLPSTNVNVDSFNIESGHSWFDCCFFLDENLSEIFGGLSKLEASIPEGTKMVLVYIAGYITRDDSGPSEEKLLNEATFCHQKYGQYLDAIYRSGLDIPTDNICQWSKKVCRKSFCNLCMMVSEYDDFEMEKRRWIILSNILLKNLAKVRSPRLGKEPALKMLKLS